MRLFALAAAAAVVSVGVSGCTSPGFYNGGFYNGGFYSGAPDARGGGVPGIRRPAGRGASDFGLRKLRAAASRVRPGMALRISGLRLAVGLRTTS